ncbi:unnamed protein product, partial [Vitis vinifera]|uniref:Uncharacterized protein n=1 Tax=Vitis vinifera TaxID=29760 RepID=D7U061_VITVI
MQPHFANISTLLGETLQLR